MNGIVFLSFWCLRFKHSSSFDLISELPDSLVNSSGVFVDSRDLLCRQSCHLQIRTLLFLPFALRAFSFLALPYCIAGTSGTLMSEDSDVTG